MKTSICLLALVLAASAPAAERWGVFEASFEGPEVGNSYTDVRWSATFTQGDRSVTVPGFWDGGNTYRVRFSPPTVGEWRYQTQSEASQLNGKAGRFRAGAPTKGNHGPVEVFQTYYLRYADGTPYHQFGTTCYVWVHQTPELQAQTLATLAASPFNKIRFCVFPKSYVYNTNEPALFAFQKGADGKFDFNRPDPAFWRHFEQRILDLQKMGIEADLILWHPYDRWGFSEMSDEEDDRFLRYCIARLGVYRNVWWSLANEYDFMTEQRRGHRGNKQWTDWDRFFSILQKEDPHQRFRGIHNGSKWYDHTRERVTHASLQTSDMAGTKFREKYRKPVIYDECKYEGNIPQGWGNLSGREMSQRFWLGTMTGCYVGHGETYKHPQDILWWAKGGVLHGESPRRIQWLRDFMAKAPPFHELRPTGDEKTGFVLSKPGKYYLLYCPAGKAGTVRLEGSRPYKVDAIDPWEMKEWAMGTARPGEYKDAASTEDVVYRFVPYAPGEKLRPEARPRASVTEGLVPLTVAFTSGEAHAVRWDFGDGTTDERPSTSHTFRMPGIHRVTLTVRDQNGASARNHLLIAVDRNTTEPIVRFGFRTNEMPAMQLHGTAKRSDDGGLQLPAGDPWGRAESDKPVEALKGLRSFTITGWAKPESLQTGSGGNRILFCLNQDRSGIDLVSLEDGRMRLAVNQWPDQVRNDSSPGKLQVGKWTFFAVTYDAKASGENVQWFFSQPMDSQRDPKVTLDRKTSHHSGPVDTGIGTLAIGNFNSTMRSYGWDRQFRGELRGVEIFGSWVGELGVLEPEVLQRLAVVSASANSR